MYVIFYLLNFFPNFGVRLAAGNFPIRYISSAAFVAFRRVRKIDLLLLFAGFFLVFYAVLFFWVRPVHGLDFAYALFFFYAFVFVTLANNNLLLFKRYVLLFWIANVVYAVFQNVAINSGVDSNYLMLHQNAHSESYVIPPHSYVKGLYRVTGLFVESAPFVFFLMLFHLFLNLFRFGWGIKFLNILFILIAGAKVGYLFLAYLMLNRINKYFKLGISVIFPALLLVFCVIFFSSYLKNVVLYFSEFVGGLGSLWVRLDGLENVVNYLFSDFLRGLFGYGHVSSAQLMSGDYQGPRRGIDVLSSFILPNGVVGSFIFLVVFCVWLKKAVCIQDKYVKNDFFVVASLMLMTMGSLQQFQYAFLVVLLSLAGRLNAYS